MRHLALADISDADLEAMLAENETLFVEHKGAIGGQGFQIAKAVCSFANGLGGWVLIGVTEGAPNAGETGGWDPVGSHQITDLVRQALRANRVDPIPGFAATVVSYAGGEHPIGVIRVYESTDTPHVMGNGQVFVRSVAEDTDEGRRYRPGGVETQAVLLSLSERGRRGAARAREKLDPDMAPLAAIEAGVSGSSFATSSRGRIGLRAVPFNGAPLAEWAVSENALPVLERVVRKLGRLDEDAVLQDPTPHASGLVLRGRSESLLALDPDAPQRDGIAAVTSDAAGVVVAAFHFGIWEPRRESTTLTLNGFRSLILSPLVEAVTAVLNGAEAYGRALLEVNIGAITEVLALDDAGGSNPIPAHLPLGGEVTLPLDPHGAELDEIAERWRSDVGRAAGYLTLRT